MKRQVLAWLVLLSVGGGCAMWNRDAARALANADTHAAHGDYPAAMAAYDSYLTRFPGDDGATRARAMRALVNELIATRAERDRLAARESELTRQATDAARQVSDAARHAAAREAELTRQAAAREAELAKLRQEMAARQAEATRLREDLEALKRTDLRMERRRR